MSTPWWINSFTVSVFPSSAARIRAVWPWRYPSAALNSARVVIVPPHKRLLLTKNHLFSGLVSPCWKTADGYVQPEDCGTYPLPSRPPLGRLTLLIAPSLVPSSQPPTQVNHP